MSWAFISAYPFPQRPFLSPKLYCRRPAFYHNACGSKANRIKTSSKNPMKVVNSLSQASSAAQPVVLTIGNFDGVHLGHQAVLNAVKQKAEQDQLLSALVTFENHPSTILRPNHPILALTS